MAEGEAPYSDPVMMISLERTRQIEEEGFTSAQDDKQRNGELALAAAYYAAPRAIYVHHYGFLGDEKDTGEYVAAWPWAPHRLKIVLQSKKISLTQAKIQNLIKAGALICAEIDRLQRAEARSQGSTGGNYSEIPNSSNDGREGQRRSQGSTGGNYSEIPNSSNDGREGQRRSQGSTESRPTEREGAR